MESFKRTVRLGSWSEGVSGCCRVSVLMKAASALGGIFFVFVSALAIPAVRISHRSKRDNVRAGEGASKQENSQ